MWRTRGIGRMVKERVCHLPTQCSAIGPISHGPDCPVSEPDGNVEYSSDSKHSDMTVVAGVDAHKLEEDAQPVPLAQSGLNSLTWDLHLSKESAQLLSSCLKEKHLLTSRTTFYRYCDSERELRQFFIFLD